MAQSWWDLKKRGGKKDERGRREKISVSVQPFKSSVFIYGSSTGCVNIARCWLSVSYAHFRFFSFLFFFRWIRGRQTYFFFLLVNLKNFVYQFLEIIILMFVFSFTLNPWLKRKKNHGTGVSGRWRNIAPEYSMKLRTFTRPSWR